VDTMSTSRRFLRKIWKFRLKRIIKDFKSKTKIIEVKYKIISSFVIFSFISLLDFRSITLFIFN